MQPGGTADDNNVFGKSEASPEERLEPGVEKGGVERAPLTSAGAVGNGIEAEFLLESCAVCPHCLEDIERVQIVRMLRTKVNFVSSLPRRGQLLVCPKCRIALAGSLGGLI